MLVSVTFLSEWNVHADVSTWSPACMSEAPVTHANLFFPIHMVSNIFYFNFLFPGIPNRLPDAVCPAALLQHVLRPPQQHWETNSAVDRPLAPQLLPAHSYSILQHPLFYWPIISTPMMNLQQKKVKGNKKHLAWWEGKIKDMDMHLSQIPPFPTYLWWKDRLQEKVEEGLGQVPFLKTWPLTILDELENGPEDGGDMSRFQVNHQIWMDYFAKSCL